MRKLVLSELRNLVTCLYNYIVLRALSFRNLVARNILKKNNKVVELSIVLL